MLTYRDLGLMLNDEDDADDYQIHIYCKAGFRPKGMRNIKRKMCWI